MPRYIDADALLGNLKRQYGEELGWWVTVNMSDVGMMIENAPTANVEPIADTVKKMQERASEIIGELVEMMFDDNMPNCIVPSCYKPDSIGCGHRICIDENKAIWLDKINQIAKEILEGTQND